MTHENVAESAVLLQHYSNKLFHMHYNDNYCSWDDDMIVGFIHLVEYIELLFWSNPLRPRAFRGKGAEGMRKEIPSSPPPGRGRGIYQKFCPL
jgi:hypothetical protein